MEKAFSRNNRAEGSAVSDRMRFTIKPIAVRSENLVSSIKASNGNTFTGDGSTQVIFDIPAMSGGYYLDTAASRFNFYLGLTTATTDAETMIYLDRGPQSIIQRWQLYDASGHLLEDINNYHQLYALTELCTSDPQVRMTRGSFFKECRHSYNDTYKITGATAEAPATLYKPDPSRGGAIFGKGEDVDDDTGLSVSNGPVMTKRGTQKMNLSCSFFSSIFGGGSEKYYPLSAMNGFRLVLTLSTPQNAFTTSANNITVAYQIYDPTLYMNMIRVDPTVDRGIITSAKGSDGKIRIHTQSWRTYSVSVLPSDTFKAVVVPISVSSLKAMFFTFTNPTPGYRGSATAFYSRLVQNYQLFIGTVAIPTTPILIGDRANDNQTITYCEAIAETLRAWHVRLQDSDFPTLLSQTSSSLAEAYASDTDRTANMVYGIELESFSNKTDTIESGANVLNNNVEIRMVMTALPEAVNAPMNLNFYALHDVFLVIDPETGITTLEF